MKATIGAHPDLPFPFSNGPEPPPDPVRGLDEPLKIASERHQNGVMVLSALLNHWLGRSDLSYDQLIAIASWGLGEKGFIDSAVISRIRNARQHRGAGLRHLDALAAANRAIWLWQAQGQGEAWKELGPHGGWGVRDKWLDGAAWLPHPEKAGQPLLFADWCDVLAGYQELPYLSTASFAPGDMAHASESLAQLLERLITARRWGPRQATEHMLEAYPVSDPVRRSRMAGVILGTETLSRDELELEMHAMAEMLRVVQGLKPGVFGPRELQAQLLASRRPGPAS